MRNDLRRPDELEISHEFASGCGFLTEQRATVADGDCNMFRGHKLFAVCGRHLGCGGYRWDAGIEFAGGGCCIAKKSG